MRHQNPELWHEIIPIVDEQIPEYLWEAAVEEESDLKDDYTAQQERAKRGCSLFLYLMIFISNTWHVNKVMKNYFHSS